MVPRRFLLPVLLLLLLLVIGPTARTQSGFHLHEGDRVVFYGDSITEQGLYTTFVEDFVVTRFPRMSVRFVNSGWGGERVSGGNGGPVDVRLERDVIAHKPTVLTIMLGMNDGGGGPLDPDLSTSYANGYDHILARVRQALPDLRLTLIRPSAYDDVTRRPRFKVGYNSTLIRYGEDVEELAARPGALIADFNSPVVDALRQAKEIAPMAARQLIPDRIHPGSGAHLVMAAALLKAWNAPSVVTAVSLDAASGQVVRQEHTHLTDLRSSDRLTWMQQDDALPMPLDLAGPGVQLALLASDVIDTLDQQPLRVTGLTAPRYMLTIDGQKVGRFTREEWAAGINLAPLPTPMAKQAAAVHALTISHNRVQFRRWREVWVPLCAHPTRKLAGELNTLGGLEASLVRQQRLLAQPKLHRYELAPMEGKSDPSPVSALHSFGS